MNNSRVIQNGESNFMEKSVIEIAKKISDNAGRLYLVGGAVRDEILGIKSSDEDYCVTRVVSRRI